MGRGLDQVFVPFQPIRPSPPFIFSPVCPLVVGSFGWRSCQANLTEGANVCAEAWGGREEVLPCPTRPCRLQVKYPFLGSWDPWTWSVLPLVADAETPCWGWMLDSPELGCPDG